MNYHSLVSKLLKFLPSNKTTMVFRDKNSWEEIYRWRSCPLDLMCLTWSFATTLSLFISLEDRIRKQIITNFGINEKHINGFIEFMKSILHLRNMISHNNVIFNHIPICFDNSSVLNMYYELFNKSIKHINLINLMELIEYFSHSKTLVSNTQYYFKKMKIESKFKEKIGLFNV
jgi:abortive infection bacteriophage resistance protein